VKTPDWKHAVAWGLSALLAFLFRVEGFIMLLLLPLACLFQAGVPASTRLGNFARLNAVTVAASAILALALASDALLQQGVQRMRLFGPDRWLSEIGWQLSGGLDAKAELLRAAILNKYSENLALIAVIAVLIALFAAKLLAVLTLPNALFAAHAWYRRLFNPGSDANRALRWVIVLNVLILAGFLIVQFFLVGRYLVPLALILMLAAPFSLTALYENGSRKHSGTGWGNGLFPAICVVLVFQAVDGLYSFGPSKAYLRKAGDWIDKNIPPDVILCSNSAPLDYYAQKRHSEQAMLGAAAPDILRGGAWNNCDYLAVAINSKQPQLVPAFAVALGKDPAARFDNARGDQVLVFRVR
ncbi:MAG: hypothetical protein ACREUA_00715, partial [Burkholderiales bacterium]